MADFTEIADRVWVARQDWFDVNVTVIAGGRGVLVVDTHASAAAARGVIDDVRRLGAGEVVGIVNTHEHFDHTFGNDAFRTAFPGTPIHAHEVAAAATVPAGRAIQQRYAAEPDDPRAAEIGATEPVAADRTFSSAKVLDLGDRLVELVHPGRGHTAGDLVVRVPDVDVLLAGDLIEESALRHGVPGFGDDCYPMEWPLTLDIVLGLLTPRSVVLPGHGLPVDRDFVEGQRNAIGVLAETVRDLAHRGIPLEEALTSAPWPFPVEELAAAVCRGYEQLPRAQKRLPLV
jgi:glyoxylase-like metal-dependent hydrolase (beta-lactamase superfamily II)